MDLCECGTDIPASSATCPSCGKPYLPLRSGTMIGRYRVDKVLGAGGFGITYRCTDTALGRTVAIKEMAPEGSWRSQQTLRPPTELQKDWNSILDQAQSEARNLADLEKLNDPGIVRVYDIMRDNNTLYIVMELVDGPTLSELMLSSGGLPELQIIDLATNLCRTLDVIHAHGIVHRDIKPQNILMPTRGPVLIDFGIAKKTIPGAKSYSGTVRGYTPGFAPREQRQQGGRIGSYTDIYALGATLYAAAMCMAPADSDDRDGAISNGEPDPLQPVKGMSKPLADAIMASLRMNRQERPQTGTQFMALIQGLALVGPAGGPLPVLQPGPAVPALPVVHPGPVPQPVPVPQPGPVVRGVPLPPLPGPPGRQDGRGGGQPQPRPPGFRPILGWFGRHKKFRNVVIVLVALVILDGIGNAVGHHSNKSSASGGGGSSSAPSGPVYLDQLTPLSGHPESTGPQSVGGKDVPHGVALSVIAGSPEQVAYKIGGHYSELQVQLGIGDNGPYPAHADILGDGNSLLGGGVDLVPNGELVSRTITVTGIRTLTLVATTSQGTFADVVFGNPLLTPPTAKTTATTAAPAQPQASTEQWLDNLQPTSGTPDYTGPFAVNGNDIPHGVGFSVIKGKAYSATYNIGGHYSEFSVVLAIGDENPNPAHLDILGDGRSLIGGGVDVVPNGELVSKMVSVKGVRQLTLVATTNQGSFSQAMFGDPLLLPAGVTAGPTKGVASTPAPSPAYLDDLNPINGSTDHTGSFTVQGRVITHGVGFSAIKGKAYYATYDLGGHYRQFHVLLAIGDQNQSPAHVDVLGDGWSLMGGGINLAANGQIVEKTIDVTGIHDLTLVATTNQGTFSQVMFGSAELLP